MIIVNAAEVIALFSLAAFVPASVAIGLCWRVQGHHLDAAYNQGWDDACHAVEEVPLGEFDTGGFPMVVDRGQSEWMDRMMAEVTNWGTTLHNFGDGCQRGPACPPDCPGPCPETLANGPVRAI